MCFNTLNMVQTLLSYADEVAFKRKAVAIKNLRREHHFYSLTSQGNLSPCWYTYFNRSTIFQLIIARN